jgi:hypothetical protein
MAAIQPLHGQESRRARVAWIHDPVRDSPRARGEQRPTPASDRLVSQNRLCEGSGGAGVAWLVEASGGQCQRACSVEVGIGRRLAIHDPIADGP